MKYEVNKENTTSLVPISQLKEPSLYQVFLHNDDYTPMEFVVSLLEKIFYMDRRKATEIMMETHIKGKAAVGVYTKDVAETKISQVVDYARSHEHPLICSMEAA